MNVGTRISEVFGVNGVYQGSVLSSPLFPIVINVATNEIKEGMLEEILYADDSRDHGGTANKIL